MRLIIFAVVLSVIFAALTNQASVKTKITQPPPLPLDANGNPIIPADIA